MTNVVDSAEGGPSRPERYRCAVVRDVLQAAFRMLPWPTEPGLRAVGRPGPDSPVIVTGNYDLTVRRLLRALAGCDAWLVVAPSRGVNVWCAAAGGHFTTHQVVSALKTCGVEERVRHRRAVLPQLAATGVQAPDVARRCGWTVRFGPAYADDLPAYLRAGMVKTDAMRRVRFDAAERCKGTYLAGTSVRRPASTNARSSARSSCRTPSAACAAPRASYSVPSTPSPSRTTPARASPPTSSAASS